MLTEVTGKPNVADMDLSKPPTDATQEARERFIERFALSLEREGMPRIAGRIFAFLLVEGSAFTFDELAERLNVSRGSVSTNTRGLETIGLIERITVPGDRRTRYQLVAEPFPPMLAMARDRLYERKQIVDELMESGEETLPASSKQRFESLQSFQDLTIDWLGRLTIRWRKRA